MARRSEHSEAETGFAASSALGFGLQPVHRFAPKRVVVVAINPVEAERVGMALALVLAYLVFAERENVGIEVEDGGSYVVLDEPFYDGRRARGATGVEQ